MGNYSVSPVCHQCSQSSCLGSRRFGGTTRMELKIRRSQVASLARSACLPGVKHLWNTNRSTINTTNERNQGLALKVGIVKGWGPKPNTRADFDRINTHSHFAFTEASPWFLSILCFILSLFVFQRLFTPPRPTALLAVFGFYFSRSLFLQNITRSTHPTLS